ncbi:MAG TPA: regulatory protein RecX [Thermoanaerobaculia bacterium]|nr:regulatory protein RecX [Thermoanaerobaculia bacterium]
MRPRGGAELERTLRERGFVEAAVAGALAKLADGGLLDDAAAARSAVRQRGARYGRARVERELKARGFARATIAAAFDAEGGAAREDEALRRAFAKLWKTRANLAPPLRRRRIFDALTRRGFPADRISEIIRTWHEGD